MAHNLNFNEKLNRHAFVTVKEPAWHRLGLIVDKAMNSEEAMSTMKQYMAGTKNNEEFLVSMNG
jgi:transcription termination factor Rho